MRKGFWIGLWVGLLLTACRQRPEVSHTSTEYARFFEIKDTAGVKHIILPQAFPGSEPYRYVLIPRKNFSGDVALSDKEFAVKMPVERYVSTSVTHLEMLKQLGVLDGMKGFTGTRYIADTSIMAMVKEGKITELGNDYFSDTERLLTLQPEVVFVFSTGGDNKQYDFLPSYGIVPVYVAEWLETHPLGRAEWIKFFGAFFDKERRADSIFTTIKNRYENVRQKAAQSPARRPVVFQGGMYGDKWYVPGGKSWAAVMIEDAGGQYIFDDAQTGSRLISHEDALLALSKADIWLNPGTWKTKEEILKNWPEAEQLKVFQTGKIYSAYIKTNSAGKNEFFEKSVLHPDRVLSDLYGIMHDSCSSCTFYAPVQ